ncbi:MAG: hypothetical protein AAF479_04380 [Pseudomonadota bacterium]
MMLKFVRLNRMRGFFRLNLSSRGAIGQHAGCFADGQLFRLVVSAFEEFQAAHQGVARQRDAAACHQCGVELIGVDVRRPLGISTTERNATVCFIHLESENDLATACPRDRATREVAGYITIRQTLRSQRNAPAHHKQTQPNEKTLHTVYSLLLNACLTASGDLDARS